MSLFACLLISNGLHAEKFETKASGFYPWSDTDAWLEGRVPPPIIQNTDTVIIRNEVVLMTSLGIRGGTLLVDGRLILNTDNPISGVILTNAGRIRVNGELILLPNPAGPRNILHNRGRVDVIGTVQNVGSQIINELTINLHSGSELINYGFQHPVEDDIYFVQSGDVYDVAALPLTAAPIGLITDSIFGSTELVWDCVDGAIDNTEGLIADHGGEVISSSCGGGYFTGPGLGSPEECRAPENLRHTGTLETGLELRWNPVPSAIIYAVGLKQAGSNSYRMIVPVMAPEINKDFDPGFFPSGMNLEWAVMSVCPGTGFDLENLSVSDAVLNRYGNTALVEGQLIDVWSSPQLQSIQVNFSEPVQQAQVLLFDLSGKMVLQEAVPPFGQQLSIRTEELQEGLYMIKVVDGVTAHQEQLLVSR